MNACLSYKLAVFFILSELVVVALQILLYRSFWDHNKQKRADQVKLVEYNGETGLVVFDITI